MRQKTLNFCLIIWNHKTGIHSIKIVNNETKQDGKLAVREWRRDVGFFKSGSFWCRGGYH